MSYDPPKECPRCRGRVVQTWAGEFPKCLSCGWADHGMPLRFVTVGIQVPLAGFDEVEAFAPDVDRELASLGAADAKLGINRRGATAPRKRAWPRVERSSNE